MPASHGAPLDRGGGGRREALPAYLTQLTLDFDFSAAGVYTKLRSSGEEETGEGCGDPLGCYYRLNGLVERSTGSGDLPVQPYFIYDSRLSGTSQHGVLWMGGLYDEEHDWIPVFGELHSTTAGNLHNLGLLYMWRGELDEAEAFVSRSLAVSEELLEESHPRIGHTLVVLGRIAKARGHHAEAEARLRRALSVYRQTLEDDHPVIVNGFYELGDVISAAGLEGDRHPHLTEADVARCPTMVHLEDVGLRLRYQQEEPGERPGLVLDLELQPDQSTVLRQAALDDATQEVDIDVPAAENHTRVPAHGLRHAAVDQSCQAGRCRPFGRLGGCVVHRFRHHLVFSSAMKREAMAEERSTNHTVSNTASGTKPQARPQT